ncbi:MAG TPA: DNA polymerase III subunit delta [Bryobacteraceae bacterium]|nr:DNA polymerase III subunit delta [Bryobacteraceae bacterium]
MSPDQFLAQIQRQEPAPVYLFLGAEPHRRDQCRRALVERVLSPEERQEGLSHYDLDETSLSDVVDDARSLSLFAPRRVICASNAEAALPRGKAGGEDEKGGTARAAETLAAYVRDPTPLSVIVLEAGRYDLEGEDKQKAERVRKFYDCVPAVVEFPKLTVQEARLLARELARHAGVTIDRAEIDTLVETVGADGMRVAAEIEKLRLYTGRSRKVQAEDVAALVPDSSASTIFVLVDALGRRDRMRALELLHKLVRQGEYLPLALSFLATLFRLALAAKEKGLRTPQQVQQQLSGPGRPIWRSRAEQILHTASIFTREQLEAVLKKIFETDSALRDANPDDRIVLEEFILRLAE